MGLKQRGKIPDQLQSPFLIGDYKIIDLLKAQRNGLSPPYNQPKAQGWLSRDRIFLPAGHDRVGKAKDGDSVWPGAGASAFAEDESDAALSVNTQREGAGGSP